MCTFANLTLADTEPVQLSTKSGAVKSKGTAGFRLQSPKVHGHEQSRNSRNEAPCNESLDEAGGGIVEIVGPDMGEELRRRHFYETAIHGTKIDSVGHSDQTGNCSSDAGD